ncbi:hypothetical protein BC628DRAFT_1297732, partial [Trametes gibbosa]
LVAGFPANRRPSFYGGHEQLIPFPFSEFAPRYFQAKPDLAMSWPGDVLPQTHKIKRLHWRQFSMTFKAKDLRSKDPFAMIRDGESELSNDCVNKLVQLAINARNLIFAHGLLAAFTLGIYGEVVRIARFDHACAVASPLINIKTKEGLQAIQEFFWQFVHPWEGGPGAVVSADPTICHLTPDDETWLRTTLERGTGELLQEETVREARWVKVWDTARNSAAIPRAFVLFKLLDVNARLFSRSTMVWLGVEDTRLGLREGSEHTVEDVQNRSDLVLRIIKEAWRQWPRPSEKMFYDRIHKAI